MLTGQTDLDAAIAAVNQGSVFQFLTKPCPPELLIKVLDAALEQHRLITSERDLLEQTLKGSIAVMTEILSLVNPRAFSRAQRISRYVTHMATELNLPGRWRYELAAMLSQIGCVTVPSEVVEKACAGAQLTGAEEEIYASHCTLGRDLLARIPRLEDVATMVERQRESWRGNCDGDPDPATIGANLLRIAADFDQRVIHGDTPEAVLGMMQSRPEYNPVFVSAMERVEVQAARGWTDAASVTVADLRPGMITGQDIVANNGLLLITKGQEVTESTISCLRNFMRTAGIAEPIRVLIRVSPAE
jgi:hypothetical protein